jgi:lycopene cyclase domain-containing protein
MIDRYSILNCGLALIVIPFALWLTSGPAKWKKRVLAVRVSTLMACIVYPWDFVSIQLGLWEYGDYVGVRLFGVPINDLVLTWLCSLLTTSALAALEWREGGREGKAE